MSKDKGKRLVTAQYASACISCEGEIEKGEPVWWAKLVGVWHKLCPEPQGVRQDQMAIERRRELGLEPPEFGDAPLLEERKFEQ